MMMVEGKDNRCACASLRFISFSQARPNMAAVHPLVLIGQCMSVTMTVLPAVPSITSRSIYSQVASRYGKSNNSYRSSGIPSAVDAHR